MYVLADQLRRLPVLSLQTGQVVALVDEPVLNPDQMEIMAFLCRGEQNRRLALMVQDVRQFHSHNILIDSADELCDPAEIVRLHELLQRNLHLVGLAVVTESGQSLGKVSDYTVNAETYLVKKVHVKPSLWRGLVSGDLIIDRSQIVDVTPKQIVVRDTSIKEPILMPRSTPAVD